MKVISQVIGTVVLLIISNIPNPHPCLAQVRSVERHRFQVKASVEPISVMAGEPMSVTVSFDAKEKRPLAILIGDAFSWCTFEICQGDRVISTWKQNVRAVEVMERHASKIVDVHEAGESIAVLPSQVMQLPVGSYTLRVHTKIRNSSEVQAEARSDSSSWKDIEEEIVTVAFSVKPLDTEQMKERVGILYRAIGREKDTTVVRNLSYQLARLPPELAKGAWRSLLLDKKIPAYKRYEIAHALSIQRTQPIAETLLYVQYTDPIRNEDGKILTLLSMLNAMAGIGGEVGEYIYREFQEHRNSPFNTPITVDGVVYNGSFVGSPLI